MFADVGGGTIRDVSLSNATVTSSGGIAGALVGQDAGTVSASHVSGAITCTNTCTMGGLVGYVAGGATLLSSHASNSVTLAAAGCCSPLGGLAGWNSGTIMNSSATGAVGGGEDGGAFGGLVGYNIEGTIDASFATGSASGSHGSFVGGLVGYTVNRKRSGRIENTYATGNVSGGAESEAGGLIGEGEDFVVGSSYSAGAVGGSGYVGGFFGYPYGRFTFTTDYWDTTTSGTNNGTGVGNESGITGETTAQLEAGLPSGFDPTIWAENPKTNNGFPYLIANPPQ